MDEVIDFSKTQRIVLFIDLHPLLSSKDSNSKAYISAILAAAKRLLSFYPLSKTLFAFKFFFSSLSPIRSASTVHRLIPDAALLTSISFHSSSETLTSLSTSITNFSIPLTGTESSNERPSMMHTANSLLQLVHDYAWESELENSKVIKQNIIFIFSPVCGSIDSLFNSMGLDVTSNQYLNDFDGLMLKFCDAFSAVKNAFVTRDIHLSWISVVCHSEDSQHEVTTDEFGGKLALIVRGIREFGWGFSSTDFIVLGSTLFPFGLIYPVIGVSYNFLSLNGSGKRTSVQLSLGILDVNGNPLECNCCDLELVNMENMPIEFADHQSTRSNYNRIISCDFLDDTRKLCIQAVHKYNDETKMGTHWSDIILVQEFNGDPKKHKKKHQSDCFADKALDILSRDLNVHYAVQTVPIWQILLSFLYREGCWASVSLSTKNGDTVEGILKPFTAHSALLVVVKDDSSGHHGCKSSHSRVINSGDCDNVQNTVNANVLYGSQGESSTSGTREPLCDVKNKKSRKNSVKNHTWSSFCKAAADSYVFDLAEIYFARYKDNKKLKFLKCWFKQVGKFNQRGQGTFYKPKDNSEPSVFPNLISEPLQMHEGAELVSSSETTSESFFDALQKRIQHGLATGMDLLCLAERLLKSAVLWSRQACPKSGDTVVQLQQLKLENPWETLFMQLIKRLLKDPKEMKPSVSNSKSEMIVREYELQVLLRMELLRLDIFGCSEDPMKRKIEKQICSFLEIIQYLIDGGIHGNVSLFEYVESTIKTRYYDVLEDTVNSIYSEMDLLPFGDEEETQALLFNSEDSSHSEKAETHVKHQSISEDDQKYEQQQEHVDESLGGGGLKNDDHELKLNEARQRRERARRFVSYSSRMPDLQRVWAPKNCILGVKKRCDSLQKEYKKKGKQQQQQQSRSRFTVVSETPMSGNKRSSSSTRRSKQKKGYAENDNGNCSNSVSKALFFD